MKSSEKENFRILITGGAGFIGSHLVEEFLHENQHVEVLDDLSGGSLQHLNLNCTGLSFQKMNLGSALSNPPLMEYLKEAVSKSDLVFHLASPIGVEFCHRRRLETTSRILSDGLSIVRACAECHTPLVFTSSSEVYGLGGDEPCRESSVAALGIEPRWGYGTAKLAVEHLVTGLYKERGIPTWIVRLFNVVGPRQRPGTQLVFPVFCSAALENKPLVIYGDGSQSRNFLHVKDAISALRLIITCRELCGEPVNIGSHQTTSILELAEQIINIYHSDSPVEFRDVMAVFGPGFVPVRCRKPDLQRISQNTRWQAKLTLTDAIQDFKNQAVPSDICQNGTMA